MSVNLAGTSVGDVARRYGGATALLSRLTNATRIRVDWPSRRTYKDDAEESLHGPLVRRSTGARGRVSAAGVDVCGVRAGTCQSRHSGAAATRVRRHAAADARHPVPGLQCDLYGAVRRPCDVQTGTQAVHVARSVHAVRTADGRRSRTAEWRSQRLPTS